MNKLAFMMFIGLLGCSSAILAAPAEAAPVEQAIPDCVICTEPCPATNTVTLDCCEQSLCQTCFTRVVVAPQLHIKIPACVEITSIELGDIGRLTFPQLRSLESTLDSIESSHDFQKAFTRKIILSYKKRTCPFCRKPLTDVADAKIRAALSACYPTRQEFETYLTDLYAKTFEAMYAEASDKTEKRFARTVLCLIAQYQTLADGYRSTHGLTVKDLSQEIAQQFLTKYGLFARMPQAVRDFYGVA